MANDAPRCIVCDGTELLLASTGRACWNCVPIAGVVNARVLARVRGRPEVEDPAALLALARKRVDRGAAMMHWRREFAGLLAETLDCDRGAPLAAMRAMVRDAVDRAAWAETWLRRALRVGREVVLGEQAWRAYNDDCRQRAEQACDAAQARVAHLERVARRLRERIAALTLGVPERPGSEDEFRAAMVDDAAVPREGT